MLNWGKKKAFCKENKSQGKAREKHKHRQGGRRKKQNRDIGYTI